MPIPASQIAAATTPFNWNGRTACSLWSYQVTSALGVRRKQNRRIVTDFASRCWALTTVLTTTGPDNMPCSPISLCLYGQVSHGMPQCACSLQAGDQRVARLLTLKRQTRSVQHACAATGSMPCDRDPTDLDPAPAPATTNDRAAGSSHREDQLRRAARATHVPHARVIGGQPRSLARTHYPATWTAILAGHHTNFQGGDRATLCYRAPGARLYGPRGGKLANGDPRRLDDMDAVRVLQLIRLGLVSVYSYWDQCLCSPPPPSSSCLPEASAPSFRCNASP